MTPQVIDALKAQLAGLSENLSQVAGALRLSRPTGHATARVSRRGFVTGALGAGVAGGAGAAPAAVRRRGPARADGAAAAAFIPFEGPHQTGITTLPIPEQG